MPLHPIAEAIINQCKKEQLSMKEMQTVKGKGDDFIFHCACSRSVMGKNLSIVGKACGIRQRLSYHMRSEERRVGKECRSGRGREH